MIMDTAQETRSDLPETTPSPVGSSISEVAALEHARRVVSQSGTSFAWGMRVLDKERRDAMYAVYAYCREIDDIADGKDDAQAKLAALNDWRQEIDRLYQGQPTKITAVALSKPVQRFSLPKKEFLLLIEGMEMDANGPIAAPGLDELHAYCRRVAGAVGMLSMPIFGTPPGDMSDRFALSLANALQFTNILRDLEEDAKIGRLYLPRELLTKNNITDNDPLTVLDAPGFTRTCEEFGAMAAAFFQEVRTVLDHIDWRTVRPALPMMGVYEQYLSRIKARGWDNVKKPIALSKTQKLVTALRYAIAPPLKS